MKVIKPQRISILQRVVEHQRRYTLVVGAIVYVPLQQPRKLLMEALMWKEAPEHVPGGVLDECYPKTRGELLVSGKAFAFGKPAAAVKLEVKVARGDDTLVDKRLAVWGDRHWKGDNTPSEASAFEVMPVDWAHAYGGEGYAKNPLGKGFAPVATEHGELWQLPNVEDPKALVTNRKDRPEPAGLGSYDFSWPQRFDKLGKRYDGRWLETLFPGPAEDFDAEFYNGAPADQRIEGFFRGDETIAIEGMHPAKRRVEGRLEPVVLRVYVTQNGDEGPRFREIATRLDTIHVLPEIERAVLVYRGTLPVADDDADDIEHLVLGAEDPRQPKSIDHYRHVLAKRLDKNTAGLEGLRDEDLMPPMSEGWAAKPDYGDMAEMTKLEHRALANMQRGREKHLAETKAELESAGFDVSADYVEEPLPPIPDPYDIDAVAVAFEDMKARMDKLKVEAEAVKQSQEEKARAAFGDAGFDYDALMSAGGAGGPPAFSAEDHLVMLHDMARIAREGGQPLPELEKDLTDPRYEEMMRQLEERVRDAYTRAAHLLPPAARQEGQGEAARAEVLERLERGESLARRSWLGADLHGLDLRRRDLAGALLEGANLAGADLSGANLAGAVLARADLTGTKLVDADLSGANLGDCVLRDTDLSGARLDRAILMKSELAGALLQGASLRGTDFIEVKFTAADFSYVEAPDAAFVQVDLRNVSFVGAKMPAARFVEANIARVDFTGADLSRSCFVQTAGDGAIFTAAALATAVFVHESSFNDASFAGADLTGANLRKTPIARADFTRARLDGTGLMACDARDANFEGISAHQALFIRTDFRGANLRRADMLGALMSKAKLQGADLTGANASRADMSLVQTDGATRIAEMLMIDTRVDPKYQPQGRKG